MRHHPLRTAVTVTTGVLLTTTVGAAVPASAAARPDASPQTPTTASVVNARWGGHCTYDRLVIDIRGTLPGVTVQPVRELRYDPSGKKVPLAGKYFLEIHLSPAAAHNDAGQSVYRGPRLTTIDLPKLKGLALTGDYEGVVTFGAAFRTKPVYNSFTLHSPERVVLDIKHANRCG